MATIHGASTWTKKESVTIGVGDSVQLEETFEGDKDSLTSLIPAIGDSRTVEGYSGFVKSVKFETGAICVLSITSDSNYEFTSGGTSSETYELNYQRVDKDIRSHRAWKTGGTYPLELADWDALGEWESKTKASEKAAAYALLSANAKQLANRLRDGQTNYPIYIPVAKKTTQNGSRPSTSSVGDISSPPSGCGAPSTTANGKSYIYIKTADSASRTQGQPWRREEEWTGFDDVDTLIYQNT